VLLGRCGRTTKNRSHRTSPIDHREKSPPNGTVTFRDSVVPFSASRQTTFSSGQSFALRHAHSLALTNVAPARSKLVSFSCGPFGGSFDAPTPSGMQDVLGVTMVVDNDKACETLALSTLLGKFLSSSSVICVL
jgi:hypothetical protein